MTEKNQKGEIVSLLTIVGIGLLMMGIIAGNVMVKKGARFVPSEAGYSSTGIANCEEDLGSAYCSDTILPTRLPIPQTGCNFGTYYYKCIPDVKCPYDNRVGVGIPYWCGQKKEGYPSRERLNDPTANIWYNAGNPAGECIWACAPDRLPATECNGQLDGKVLNFCYKKQCINYGGMKQWIFIEKVCQGKELASYEKPGKLSGLSCPTVNQVVDIEKEEGKTCSTFDDLMKLINPSYTPPTPPTSTPTNAAIATPTTPSAVTPPPSTPIETPTLTPTETLTPTATPTTTPKPDEIRGIVRIIANSQKYNTIVIEACTEKEKADGTVRCIKERIILSQVDKGKDEDFPFTLDSSNGLVAGLKYWLRARVENNISGSGIDILDYSLFVEARTRTILKDPIIITLPDKEKVVKGKITVIANGQRYKRVVGSLCDLRENNCTTQNIWEVVQPIDTDRHDIFYQFKRLEKSKQYILQILIHLNDSSVDPLTYEKKKVSVSSEKVNFELTVPEPNRVIRGSVKVEAKGNFYDDVQILMCSYTNIPTPNISTDETGKDCATYYQSTQLNFGEQSRKDDKIFTFMFQNLDPTQKYYPFRALLGNKGGVLARSAFKNVSPGNSFLEPLTVTWPDPVKKKIHGRIEYDVAASPLTITTGDFDPSLLKYRIKSSNNNSTNNIPIPSTCEPLTSCEFYHEVEILPEFSDIEITVFVEGIANRRVGVLGPQQQKPERQECATFTTTKFPGDKIGSMSELYVGNLMMKWDSHGCGTNKKNNPIETAAILPVTSPETKAAAGTSEEIYFTTLDQWMGGKKDVLAVSGVISQLKKAKSLKLSVCDPVKGECRIP